MSQNDSTQGKGKSLFLFHGWGQSQEHLKPLAELIKPWAVPHLFDLPGFGSAPPPNSVWSAFDYADHFKKEMDEQGIKKTSLLGHSFGGKIALCLALRYPESVDKLILIGSSGVPPKRTLKKQARLLTIKWTGKSLRIIDKTFGTDCFNQSFAPRFGSKDYQNAGPMRPILVKSVNEDLSEHLPTINCPTLLLWGGKDTETPLEMGVRMSKLIPRSELRILPHHNHYPFEDAGAHLLATYIGPFL